MGKGNGFWKVVAAGVVFSVAVSGGMYLSVPKPADVDLGVNKASDGEYDRTLYGIPDVNMGHYKLDDDSYFKYKVDGTLDISRSNPSSVPNWLSDFEIWSNDEAFAEDRVAFNEKRMSVLDKVGDVEAASSVEESLKDSGAEDAEEGAEGSVDDTSGDVEGVEGSDGASEGATSNYVGDDASVSDVGDSGNEESSDGMTDTDENGDVEDDGGSVDE